MNAPDGSLSRRARALAVARSVAFFFLPFALLLAAYGSQRLWIDAARARVRVAEPRAWELAWFGVTRADGARETVAAWWQRHPHAVLDVVCGAAYLAFAPAFLAAAAWWRFGKNIPRADRVMWAMLALYLAGIATYALYPAAPPWYADRFGFGPAALDAAPDAAGLARFDAALGVQVSAAYYGRSANVFGAIPSLHVGLTFLGALFAWRFRSLRAALTTLWAVTLFSSVYLNHHYLVDGLVGMVFAAAVFAVTEWRAVRAARRSRPQSKV